MIDSSNRLLSETNDTFFESLIERRLNPRSGYHCVPEYPKWEVISWLDNL